MVWWDLLRTHCSVFVVRFYCYCRQSLDYHNWLYYSLNTDSVWFSYICWFSLSFWMHLFVIFGSITNFWFKIPAQSCWIHSVLNFCLKSVWTYRKALLVVAVVFNFISISKFNIHINYALFSLIPIIHHPKTNKMKFNRRNEVWLKTVLFMLFISCCILTNFIQNVKRIVFN